MCSSFASNFPGTNAESVGEYRAHFIGGCAIDCPSANTHLKGAIVGTTYADRLRPRMNANLKTNHPGSVSDSRCMGRNRIELF